MATEEYFRGPPTDVEGMHSLKVDNLTYRTTVEELTKLFTKYGKIGDVYIPRSARGSRGFAFVRFFDKRDAEDAMKALDGIRVDGRDIRIQMARYARPQAGGGRVGGGRDRSRDRSRDRDRRDDRRDDDRRRRPDSRERRRSSSRERRRSRERSPARRYGRRD